MRKIKQQTLSELKEQQRKTNAAIGRLEDEKRRAANAPLVGKTFKYRNSYSCPEGPADYWWLYTKVTKVNGAGHIEVFSFETDKYGNISIRFDTHRYHMDGGYEAISAAEYRKALKAMQASVGKLQ